MKIFSTLALAALSTSALAEPSSWPQWRGPDRNGIVAGKKWPDSLAGLKLKWRIDLDKSYAGPIVSDDLVFTTESRDKTFEVVRALKRSNGEEVWKVEWEGYQGVPFFAASNGDWVRSTPAYDGKHLYVGGMRDVLVCLVAATGEEKWRVDFVKETKAPPPAFGFVCSPLIDGDALYVQAGAAFCKLDKATGKIIWRSLEDGGGMWGSAFSSPMTAQIQGKKQILVQTRENLCGIDPESGKQLWSQKIKAFRGMNILTPVVAGNRIFTSAYGGQTAVYEAGKSEDGTAGLTVSWENKAEGYMSTPVVIAGKVFLHQRNKRFACFDMATGQNHWTTEEKFGEYWSLVAQGGRILALDERGLLYYIQADPKAFQLIEQKKISDESTWAHLAVCEGEVYIRELKALACWEWK